MPQFILDKGATEQSSMPRIETIEKTLFKFDELSDAAKEKAREWWRNLEQQDCDLLDSDDYKTCAEILGIEFDTRPVKLMGGGARYEPQICYGGFSSQGNGASFKGRYAYAKQAPKKIRAHAPLDAELHRIADALYALQRRYFYRIEARVTRGAGSNFYSHSGTMRVETGLSNGEDIPRIDDDRDDRKGGKLDRFNLTHIRRYVRACLGLAA